MCTLQGKLVVGSPLVLNVEIASCWEKIKGIYAVSYYEAKGKFLLVTD